MDRVCKVEKCALLPEKLALRISMASERNLRRALLMLEACRVQQHPFSPDQEVGTRGCCRWPPRVHRSDLLPHTKALHQQWRRTIGLLLHGRLMHCRRSQVEVSDWEAYIAKLARLMTQEQSPQQVCGPCVGEVIRLWFPERWGPVDGSSSRLGTCCTSS
jgi:hypothetical protein